MLAHIASPEQKERFLAPPLAHGDMRSAFAMTEPSPGAGSDPPSALTTRAEKVPGGWKINGHKYFITGADGAGFFIIFARTSGVPGDRGGATMFLTPADAEGLRVGRHIDTLDRAMIGGHCEVFFEDLFVPDSGVLGEVDQGFAYAQVRLGPARMTHVMRWLGAARRGHDVAVAHVAQREGFGGKLGDLGMVQKMIADNEIDIAATRALLTRACWELDQAATRATPRPSPRPTPPRPSSASSTAPSRCAAVSACPVTCPSPGCPARCDRSVSTTDRPRCTAGPSPSVSSVPRRRPRGRRAHDRTSGTRSRCAAEVPVRVGRSSRR